MTGRSLLTIEYTTTGVLQLEMFIITSTSAYRYSQYKLVEKQIMIFLYRVNCVPKHQPDNIHSIE